MQSYSHNVHKRHTYTLLLLMSLQNCYSHLHDLGCCRSCLWRYDHSRTLVFGHSKTELYHLWEKVPDCNYTTLTSQEMQFNWCQHLEFVSANCPDTHFFLTSKHGRRHWKIKSTATELPHKHVSLGLRHSHLSANTVYTVGAARASPTKRQACTAGMGEIILMSVLYFWFQLTAPGKYQLLAPSS